MLWDREPCTVRDVHAALAAAAVRLGWVCVHSLWQCAAVAAALAVALRLIPPAVVRGGRR